LIIARAAGLVAVEEKVSFNHCGQTPSHRTKSLHTTTAWQIFLGNMKEVQESPGRHIQ